MDHAVLEYRASGSSAWNIIDTIQAEPNVSTTTFTKDWSVTDLDTGDYELRVSVYDWTVNDTLDGKYASNAPGTLTKTVHITKYIPPVAPTVTAETGYKSVTLNWSYTGNEDLLNSFSIYKATSADGDYSLVKTVTPSTKTYSGSIPEDQTVYFKVVANDKDNEAAESNAVDATSKQLDTEAPIAVISPETLLTAKGLAFQFSAINSTDNNEIASYSWDFGDGSTSVEVTPEHTYGSAGNYPVKLTVTDTFGNSNTAAATIKVVDTTSAGSEYTLVTLKTVDASSSNLTPISDATIQIIYESGEKTTAVTGTNGTKTILMPIGNHVLSVTADSYMPTSKNLKVSSTSEGTMEATIGLSATQLVVGELTTTEMTYEEIIAAGIDVTDPNNQHVWKFAATLKFHVGIKEYAIPETETPFGYINLAGEYIPSPGGWYDLEPTKNPGESGQGDPHSGDSYSGETTRLGVFPTTQEGFYLVIYGEAHWLKEMYNVELLVINTSNLDSVQDCTAEIVLPDGLSLATMLDQKQTAQIKINDIAPGQQNKARWYVTGDKEGEYNLSANVTGDLVSGNISEPFSYNFATNNPVKVYAGSALKMTITADDVAERGQDYHVVFRLENVSDKSLYNLSFGITGIEQFKLESTTKGGGLIHEEKTVFDSIELGDTLMREVGELAPGGYYEIAADITCWFKSDAEIQVTAAKTLMSVFRTTSFLSHYIDVAYYLDGVTVATLEGSTTTIPCEIVVNQTERDSLIDQLVFDFAKEKLGIKDGSLGGTIIEVAGEGLGIGKVFISGAKNLLKLQQGETDYKFTISIDDGKATDNSIYNDYVVITKGDGFQGFIDTVNGTKLKIDGGEFSIQAKGPGNTKIKIGVENSLEHRTSEYTVDVSVEDVDLTSSMSVGKTNAEGKIKVNENEFKATIEARNNEDREIFHRNPYLWYEPELKLNIDSTASNSNYSAEVSADSLSTLYDKSIVSKLTYNDETTSISFDRAAIDTICDAVRTNNDSSMIVSAYRLTDSEALNMGSSQPTYLLAVENQDGELLSDFGDGKAYISLPYDLEAGRTCVIEHIKEDGTKEYIQCQYNSSTHRVEFYTNSFSYFRIVEFDGEILETEPTIAGNATQNGCKLTASVEGVDNNELIYTWYRGDDFSNPIATGNEYTITYNDSNTVLLLPQLNLEFRPHSW